MELKETSNKADQQTLVENMDKVNMAIDLDEDTLVKISKAVVEGYEVDKGSRSEWERETKVWMDLALQVANKKTFPWTDASNVKFPLISIAAMQFSARAYPSLVPQNGKIVNCSVVGKDPDGSKKERALRISKHMSYQVMEEMEEWEEDMDKLLLHMAITGIAFKKTYYSPEKGRNVSKLVYGEDLVVNNYTSCLEDAERITEVFYYSPRKVKEMQMQGLYRDVKLGEPSGPREQTANGVSYITTHDETTPHTILEQHTYYDMDGDGYAEPYIITVDYDSKEVLRVAACYNKEGIKVNDEGDVVRIEAMQYYTKFGAIPNPRGSFYNIGFGHLLGPINESVNTIINQLIDAGSLSNLQSGFLGKGLRMKMGDARFRPGEWKSVNATGDDIKKQIFPLPVREPSGTLFQLMGTLITSGKELASVADIMVGKMPGQNTPAYTTKETVDQGMKLFTAIYKRVYRSLKAEFRKLYELNRIYLDPQQYIEVIDEQVEQADYEGDAKDIIPAADPSAASATDKMTKVQEIFPLMQLGTLDPMELTKRALEAQEQPSPETLMKQPSPPPPDPKMEALKAKAQVDGQKAQMDMDKGQQDMQLKERAAQLDAQSKMMDIKFKEISNTMEMQMKKMDHIFELQKSQTSHRQEVSHTQDMFTLKAIEQANKAEAAAEPKVTTPKEPKPRSK
jgi:chaperonin GroES